MSLKRVFSMKKLKPEERALFGIALIIGFVFLFIVPMIFLPLDLPLTTTEYTDAVITAIEPEPWLDCGPQYRNKVSVFSEAYKLSGDAIIESSHPLEYSVGDIVSVKITTIKDVEKDTTTRTLVVIF